MSNSNQGGPAGQGPDSEAARVLRAARERIWKGWCRHAEARDIHEHPVAAASGDAVAWCMAGALLAVGCEVDGPDRPEAVRLVERVTGREAFGDWNDDQESVEPVIAALDRAIALAEGNAAQPPSDEFYVETGKAP